MFGSILIFLLVTYGCIKIKQFDIAIEQKAVKLLNGE